uniref:RING-type E3 ubiquitin transferase n=1 Tax=Chrysemys picta bellii TaxID=8478 RepID=A0A8C3HP25_CHRPI
MDPGTNPVERLQDEAVCPICLDCFTEPVSIDCGHNFCCACISRYCETWKEESIGKPVQCPVCKKKFKKDNFRSNWQLANMVENILKLRAARGEERAGPFCQHHQEQLKLFCEEDGKAICVVCRESREHREHTVAPVEEAAQTYRVRVRWVQGLLGATLLGSWVLITATGAAGVSSPLVQLCLKVWVGLQVFSCVEKTLFPQQAGLPVHTRGRPSGYLVPFPALTQIDQTTALGFLHCNQGSFSGRNMNIFHKIVHLKKKKFFFFGGEGNF